MPPSVLAGTGFAARTRACIVRPGLATYMSGPTESELDYFVLSERLQAAVESIRVLDGAPIAKHSPVVLRLTGKARSDTVTMLARPPRWPRGYPAACSPEPRPAEAWDSIEGERPQQRVDRLYGDWAMEADAQIASLYGLEAAGGRQQPPRMVRKPVLPRGGAGPKLEPLLGTLRAAVQLGKVLVDHRAGGRQRQAHATWVRAMRLCTKRGTDWA
jgi:hypothetical protein